jgi:hypothetical protein
VWCTCFSLVQVLSGRRNKYRRTMALPYTKIRSTKTILTYRFVAHFCYHRPYSKSQQFSKSCKSNGKCVVLPAQNLCLQQNCSFPLSIFIQAFVVHTMILLPSIETFSLSSHSSYSSCAFACLMTTPAAGVVRVANKFPGGTVLQKELQGFASFVAFQNSCFCNGSTAMAKVTQERVLAEQYFGNPDDPDSVGIVQQLVEGTGIFVNSYDDTEEMIQQTSSQQAGNSRSNLTLALKPYLHCLSGTSVIVGNQSNNTNLALVSQILANQGQISSYLSSRAYQEWKSTCNCYEQKESIQILCFHAQFTIGHDYGRLLCIYPKRNERLTCHQHYKTSFGRHAFLGSSNCHYCNSSKCTSASLRQRTN